jgi:hypothetical protein
MMLRLTRKELDLPKAQRVSLPGSTKTEPEHAAGIVPGQAPPARHKPELLTAVFW